MNTTRVTAKYIRRLAKEYRVTIDFPLRSQSSKLLAVEMIGEAIIASELRKAIKEDNENFYKLLCNEIGNRYRAVIVDGFTNNYSIQSIFTNKSIGNIQYFLGSVTYRYFDDSRSSTRKASLIEAVNNLRGYYEEQLDVA